MQKKVLFIIPSLKTGGAEKSLINILQVFDYHKFSVDLLLLHREGTFLNQVPQAVHLLDLPPDFHDFSKGLFSAILTFFRKGKFMLALHRFLFSWKVALGRKRIHATEQVTWQHLKHAIGVLPSRYDFAVGYLEKTSIYCCVDCVDASKKIGFIRTDYSKLNLNISIDLAYFSQLTYLCANGYTTSEVLKSTFPSLLDRCRVVLNVISAKNINLWAEEKIALAQFSCPMLLSIGRVEEVKGFNLAVEAALLLKQRQVDFRWIIIGDGSQRIELAHWVAANNLQAEVIFLGEIANPYPYLKRCDLYVQTSYFEGRSSTIQEAKVMLKPILSTNFDSVYELIEDGKNGVLVNQTAEAIAEGLYQLIHDAEKRAALSEALASELQNTSGELAEFYALFT